MPMIRTPGTNIEHCDVCTWINGMLAIQRRAPSASRYRQIEAHLAALGPAVIEAERDAYSLELLRALLRNPCRHLCPPRGARAGSHYERLMVQTGNQLARLQRSERPATAWGECAPLFS